MGVCPSTFHTCKYSALISCDDADYAMKKKHGEPKKHLDWAIVEA